MLSLPPAVRIFAATAPTNMHLSFDRLAALARDVLAQDPLSGHLFAFFSRSADAAELMLLLDGIELATVTRRPRYRTRLEAAARR